MRAVNIARETVFRVVALTIFALASLEGQGFLFQPDPDMEPAPSDAFRTGVREALPNLQLPEAIPAAPGEVTVFADYDRAADGSVPIYVVNRSAEKFSLGAQDGDLYFKLEFRDPETGLWVRAQTHRDSGCGNSYNSKSLEPGEHFTFPGYFPLEGQEATVRYRSWRQGRSVISNLGKGHVVKADLEAAKYDGMAFEEIPSALSECLQDIYMADPDETYAAALDMLSAFQESAIVRRETRRLLDDPERAIAPAVREKMETTLAEEWPHPPESAEALFALALEAIDQSDAPEVGWRVLDSQLGDPSMSGLLKKHAEKIITDLGAALGSDRESEVIAATRALKNAAFVNEHLSDDRLLDWLRNAHTSGKSSVTQVLAKRERFDEIVGIADEFTLEEKVLVLAALVKPGDFRSATRNPSTELESDFWEQTIREAPEAAALRLRYLGGYGARSYDRVVHDPLADHLKAVAENAGTTPRETGWSPNLSSVVALVGAFRMKEDIPVFKALLGYPVFEENSGYTSELGEVIWRRYPVRREARDALLDLGVAVDPDLVVEEVIPKKDAASKIR